MIRLLIAILLLSACKEYPEELSPVPDNTEVVVVTPEPTPEPENPICTGQTGFVYKPISDPNSRKPNVAVVLLPYGFPVKFDSVCIVGSENDQCAESSGFSNGDRQTWRFDLPGCDFGKNFEVHATEAKQVCTWKIPRGCRRKES